MPSKYGYRGYGAARTPGSQDRGLQDEKLSAGEIYSAKTGKLISKKMNKGGGYDAGVPGMFRDIASKGGFRPIPTTPKGGSKVIGPDDSRYGRAKKHFEGQERKKKIKAIGKAIAQAAIPGAGAVGIVKKIVSSIKGSGSSGKSSKGMGGKTGGKGRPTTTKYDPSRNPNPKTPKMKG